MFTTGCLLTSCNEDVDLIGDFKETAVVYGLLNQAETIHYIKINRAFIGPGNSLEIAQIPDSNYFDQVDATVTEFVNDVQDRQWVLMDTLIENKETGGVFFAPFQKVYYFITSPTDPLNENATYKLHISINGGEFEIDGETELVSGISLPQVDLLNYRYDFIENDGSYAQNSITNYTGNSYILNTTLEVNYEELNTGVDTIMKSFKWKLGETQVQPDETVSFTMSGKTFYDLVKANASTDPLIDRRRLYSIKAIITAGAEDLNNYITVNEPSSSLAQNKPTYTNLTVTGDHRVVGIFSSRYTYTVEKLYINPFNTALRMITKESVAELCIGSVTGSLLFCSQHPADNGESWYCD
jgi:hypothetical protein